MQKVIKATGDDFTEINKLLEQGYAIISTQTSCMDGYYIFVLCKPTGAI